MDGKVDSMTAVRHRRGGARNASAVRSATVSQAEPTAIVFSADDGLASLAQQAVTSGWKLELCRNAGTGREVLSQPNIRLVIVDDESVPEEARGWLLDRIRRFVPRALLIYIAGSHSPDDEKRARGYAAQYYTAKPLDTDRTLRVLQSFVRVAEESKDGNGNGA
jgi:DNA-binding NtrC family response regulator